MVAAPLSRYAVLAILAALVTIAVKTLAYHWTGSIGLFADALESGVNLLAAVTAYLSLRYAARPADPEHAFGHQKIEFFSSGLEGVLIILAGIVTAYEAIHRLVEPQPLHQLGLGAVAGATAAVINFAVGLLLVRVGQRQKSIVLEAAGKHLLTDVWTTAAVLAGLILVEWTKISAIDAILAAVVGLQIVRTGFTLVRQSFNGLMDHALPAEEQEEFRTAIRNALPQGADFHLLRTRQAGRRTYLDFHLLLDGDLSVREAHQITHTLASKLRAGRADLELSIHIEPIDESESWEEAELQALGEPIHPAPTPSIPPPIDD
jgi:cation diffusion facilitator family transporter